METTSKPKFVYVTYIATTPEKLWEALTKADFTEKYWFGSRIKSEWKVGSPFRIQTGVADKDWHGKVLHYDPPRLLSYTFRVAGGAEHFTRRLAGEVLTPLVEGRLSASASVAAR